MLLLSLASCLGLLGGLAWFLLCWDLLLLCFFIQQVFFLAIGTVGRDVAHLTTLMTGGLLLPVILLTLFVLLSLLSESNALGIWDDGVLLVVFVFTQQLVGLMRLSG